MAWTRTDIANKAAGYLGVGKQISEIDTDTTEEAKSIRAVFDMAMESVLSELDWGFARTRAELSLVSDENEDHNGDWKYAYRYPSGCLLFKRVVASDLGDRNPSEESEIPWGVETDDSGRLIVADEADAQGEYIYAPEEGLLPAKFVLCVSLKIAMLAGPRLERDAQSGSQFLNLYEQTLSEAKAVAANEGGYELRPDTPSLRARRGWTPRQDRWSLP